MNEEREQGRNEGRERTKRTGRDRRDIIFRLGDK
jgi:hypothetical protein